MTVAKRGDRFACLEPLYDAVTERFGRVDKDLARGISLRHDWGPQYTSGHFQGAISWLGIEDSPAFAGEPPCNGCAERFIRTLKEQCLCARLYEDVEDLRQAVIAFTRRYNDEWCRSTSVGSGLPPAPSSRLRSPTRCSSPVRGRAG